MHIWNIRFIRDVNDWELEAVDSLMETLYSNMLNSVGPNTLRWNLNGNGRFNVRSYYESMRFCEGLLISFSLGRAFGVLKDPKTSCIL